MTIVLGLGYCILTTLEVIGNLTEYTRGINMGVIIRRRSINEKL